MSVLKKKVQCRAKSDSDANTQISRWINHVMACEPKWHKPNIVESCCCSFAQNYVQLFITPWTAAHWASLFFIICQSLLKLISIESVMPSNHLILFHSLLHLPSIFPSFGVFSSESALYIRWPKCWSFRFSISPSNEYSGLICFRIDSFLLSKELLRILE